MTELTNPRLLTTSRAATFRLCPREEHLAYGLGYRPVVVADSLRFGTLWHLMMEAWWIAWKNGMTAQDALARGLAVLPPEVEAAFAAGARGYLLASPHNPTGRVFSAADLSRIGSLADRYGVTYTLQPQLRDFYRGLGHDLPQINRSNNWRVPLPATFVIGRDGRVVLTHVEPVLYHRLEPEAALTAVRRAEADAQRSHGPRADAPA